MTTTSSPSPLRRACVIVLDSVGVGALPDADTYGDAGADTLGHIAAAAGTLDLPNLTALGLGNIPRPHPLPGAPAVERPPASVGKMAQQARGKDTTSGHWELAGFISDQPFQYFPQGFPPEILEPWCRAIGVDRVLGNKPASGTEILVELGEEHVRTGLPIVYTSADSVFQLAAHESVVPLPKLYDWCKKARAILDRYQVARVIARPFTGEKGAYARTYNRHDYSLMPGTTLLDRLTEAGVPVVGVGKIPDIYAHRGISREVPTTGNDDGMEKTTALMKEVDRGLVFTNLVDFDMLYGHRRDPAGYHQALRRFDRQLPGVLAALRDGDLLILTADHGNDPTHPGSDHTREYVPLLCVSPARKVGTPLGVRESFGDVAETLREGFGLVGPMAVGKSFLSLVA
jgi:phosphopentomutase